MSNYHHYWGKARPATSVTAPYHLLPYHCLDVTAVAAELWDAAPHLRASFTDLLAQDEPTTRNLLLFLIACHDLGKFADAFQNLAPSVRQALQGNTPSTKAHVLRHDSLGFLLWQNVLDELPIDGDLAETLIPLVMAVTGHHGHPPEPVNDLHLKTHFLKSDLTAAKDFIRAVFALFPFTPRKLSSKSCKRTSLFLAGITMVSDWAGSHQAHFPYQTQIQPLPDYFTQTRDRARAMLAAVELIAPPPAAETGMAHLFPAYRPSPLQALADQQRPQPGPQLYIIEDLTGAGKTEAAMTLAHALMQQGATGLFVGLPTTATADQMYQRLEACYTRFYNQKPFLMLAHSARQANPHFRHQLGLESPEAVAAVAEDKLPAAETRLAHWLADNAKKSLLAAIGVGTIDQALLAGLRKNHAPLRLFGLMGKVLIVDELHAYDAYMQAQLENLVELHTLQGGSTILLSATLASQQRQAYIARFQSALGRETTASQAQAYPLLTHVDQSGLLTETPVAATGCREIHIEWLHQDPLPQLIAWAAEGKAVCWLRNTVRDATAAYERLRALPDAPPCQLFHARFALVDRLAIQADVLARFGKASGAAQRAGRIVIATQVIEQSLDVDFDRMISDLAPIDLLIQRDGRQMRHPRDASGNPLPDRASPDQRGPHIFTVHAPAWSEAPDIKWLKETLRGTAQVYENKDHLLWLSMRELRARPSFQLPRDARALVDGVYEETEIPAGLRPIGDAQIGQYFAHRAFAKSKVYRPDSGYELDDRLNEDEEFSTRLGLDQVKFHLAIWDGTALQPYAQLRNPNVDPSQAWFQSQINLPKSYGSARVADAIAPETVVRDLETRQSGHLKILPLRPEGQAFVGLLHKGDQPQPLRYDPVLGAVSGDSPGEPA